MKHILTLALTLTFTVMGACSGKSENRQVTDDSVDTVMSNQGTSENAASENETVNVVKESEEANETVAVGKVQTKIVNNGKPTVIDFSAVWCGPCKMMKPIFEKLATEYGNKINFVSIDVDDNPELAKKYQIQSIPTFVFLDEDGKEANRINGAVPENELRNEIANGVWY